MAASKSKAIVHKNNALVLKRVLLTYRISQAALCRAVAIPTSTLSEIINWNNWPINKPAKDIRTSVDAFLKAKNVPRETLLRIWALDNGDDMPVSPHASKKCPPKKAPVRSAAKEALIIHENLPENAMLTQQAKTLFKLLQDPFVDDVHGPDDVFQSTEGQYVNAAMYQTAKRGGFIAVVGESGAGKTTLRRNLCERIEKNDPNIRIVAPRVIDKKRLTASSICDAILTDFDQKPASSLEGKARQIEKLLKASASGGNSHVIMIEEAHDVLPEVLKYLKRFWEIGDGFKKLISIILIGQPELRNTLNEHLHPEIREVSRRCEIIELQPLGANLKEYLALKLKRVHRTVDDVFEAKAIDAIRDRLSVHRGQSRKPINMAYPLIVNNCVTSAMNQCVELGLAKITADLVREL